MTVTQGVPSSSPPSRDILSVASSESDSGRCPSASNMGWKQEWEVGMNLVTVWERSSFVALRRMSAFWRMARCNKRGWFSSTPLLTYETILEISANRKKILMGLDATTTTTIITRRRSNRHLQTLIQETFLQPPRCSSLLQQLQAQFPFCQTWSQHDKREVSSWKWILLV